MELPKWLNPTAETREAMKKTMARGRADRERKWKKWLDVLTFWEGMSRDTSVITCSRCSHFKRVPTPYKHRMIHDGFMEVTESRIGYCKKLEKKTQPGIHCTVGSAR